MDLSILIISWNTRDLLAQCLDSVYASAPECTLEVLVVDNASHDGSPQTVRERFPQAWLVENSENVGFARANNQALRESRGRYVLLLNSDTVVQPGALARMVAFLEAHPGVGIVGAYLLNPDGTPQWCFGPFPSLLSEAAAAWGLNARRPFSTWFGPRLTFSAEYLETGWVLGAALMVRREALDQVGLLDEGYFMFSEEVDLAYRASRAGWKNYVLNTARIVHLGQQSTRQVPARMKAELFRSKVRYFRKHHGPLAATLLRWNFAASILARRTAYRLKGEKVLEKLWIDTWGHFLQRSISPSGSGAVRPQRKVATSSSARSPRMMIFGLDGGTFDIIKPLVRAGRLPNLTRLLTGGAHGVLESARPPITPSGWTSFMTGKGPARHRLFDFERFVPGTHLSEPVPANRHGHHSLWRILSERGRRVVALDVPFTYPPEKVNGSLIAGYGVPLGQDVVFTHPPELREELRRAVGRCDPAALEQLPNLTQALFDEWDEILANREAIAEYLLKREAPDVFMLVFGVIDNVQHALWNFLDPLHPSYYARHAAEHREKLFAYYERVDAIIGRLLAHAGEETHVLVMSDHGFGSTRPGLFISAFLAEGGWLHYRSHGLSRTLGHRLMDRALEAYNRWPAARSWLRGMSTPALERVKRALDHAGVLPATANIDWARTKAFATRFGLNVYLNASEVFPGGTVQPEEHEALCDELTERLLALRKPKSGRRLVRHVHRVRDEGRAQGDGLAPDLIVEYANFYSPETDPDPSKTIEGLDGSHVPEGIFIYHGPDARVGREFASAQIVDVAPTVLYLLGLPVPSDMDGRVMAEALRPGLLAERPVEFGPPAFDPSPAAVADYTPEEQEAVRQQLRALGYVD